MSREVRVGNADLDVDNALISYSFPAFSVFFLLSFRGDTLVSFDALTRRSTADTNAFNDPLPLFNIANTLSTPFDNNLVPGPGRRSLLALEIRLRLAPRSLVVRAHAILYIGSGGDDGSFDECVDVGDRGDVMAGDVHSWETAVARAPVYRESGL